MKNIVLTANALMIAMATFGQEETDTTRTKPGNQEIPKVII